MRQELDPESGREPDRRNLENEYAEWLAARGIYEDVLERRGEALWAEFLIQREDDGSVVFGRAVLDELAYGATRIERMSEEDDQAQRIFYERLYEAGLKEKYRQMFEEWEDETGVHIERKKRQG